MTLEPTWHQRCTWLMVGRVATIHFTRGVHLTAAGKLETAGSKVVEGDILKLDGEFYTVHDMAAHEVRLHVNKTTHLEGDAFKVGDKVEAYATDKGHVRYLYHLAQMTPAP